MDDKRREWLLFLKWARDFREQCLIEKGRVWNDRPTGPYCILHWMPMLSTGKQSVDMDFIGKDIYKDFIAFREDIHVKCQYNPNGLLIDTNLGADRGQWSAWAGRWCFYLRGFQYTQIFPSGSLEAVYAPMLEKRAGKETIYLSLYAFEFFRRQIKNCIESARVLGFSGKGVIGVTLTGVKGYPIYTPIISARYLEKFARQPQGSSEVFNSAEEDPKIEMRIDDIPDIEEIDERILYPIFDVLWHHFGFPECDRNFQDGSWELQK